MVKCTDDTSLPISTFRVYFLGTLWCILGSGVNQFFSCVDPLSLPALHFSLACASDRIRQPSFSITVNEIQLLSVCLALFMAVAFSL